VLEIAESIGAAAYTAIGLAGLVMGGAFLTNFLPTGSFNDLLSGGTVPLLNGAVGVAVAAAIVLLLSGFLEQAVVLRRTEEPLAGSSIGTEEPLAGSSIGTEEPLAGSSIGTEEPLAGSSTTVDDAEQR
jgi:hypothetical protein